MNARIKELFKQTALHRNDHTTEQRLYEVEKFAELIVRECISALEEKIHRSIDHEGDEIWADLILKENLGVEE